MPSILSFFTKKAYPDKESLKPCIMLIWDAITTSNITWIKVSLHLKCSIENIPQTRKKLFRRVTCFHLNHLLPIVGAQLKKKLSQIP
jgi:hypothetical protein